MMDKRHAILALEDGSVFRGTAFGESATVVGEAVFNTSMTGYQEILTDPSYYGQIVTMTAPQIGNYGIIPGDDESDGPKVAGFVIRELSPVVSNWRATSNLHDFLAEHGIPGIEGVDTRTITKRIRVKGALKSCLSTEGLSDEGTWCSLAAYCQSGFRLSCKFSNNGGHSDFRGMRVVLARKK
ncbi:MAG: carbamoyl-phosphate synthase domain-containing protein [Opitutales bacterium]